MSESSDGQSNGDEGRGRHRKRAIELAAAAVAVEAAGLWRRGYGVGGNVVVRCRAGHLFTTIWLPAVSLKITPARAVAIPVLPGREALVGGHARQARGAEP